jgi:peptide/nickel transport system permease protein
MTGRRALVAAGTVMLVVVLAGPTLAGEDAVRTVASPWAPPGPGLSLGADALGRDVLARVLAGGRDLFLVAGGSALVATALGTAAGLWAGWSDGPVARGLAGGADLLMALPLLLLALVAAMARPGPSAVLVGTALGGAPLTLRVVADVTRRSRRAGYVRAALARGEPGPTVLLREVLPAHSALVAADLGMRAVLALQLAAALSVLGFGPPPPAPDWASMLRDNLAGLPLNPAGLLAPAAALAVLAAALAAGARAADGRVAR